MNPQGPPTEASGIEDVLRSFPEVLDALQSSYVALSERAERVETELRITNIELAAKVQELNELQRHQQAVLESLPCGVLERDETGRIVQVNSAARELLGVAAEPVVPMVLPADRSDFESFVYESASGNRVVLSSKRSSVRDEHGEVLGEVEILNDLTEKTRLEERLRSADKMAALGTMAGGIAHEIRNPLNAIKGFALLLDQRESTDEKAMEWTQHIVTAATKANTIIESILSFGDPEALVSEVLEPIEFLGHLARIVREDFPDQDIEVIYESTAPRFRGDDMKLRHALRNLVANAVQVQDDEPQITVKLFQDQDEIVARVDDAGPGVDAELRNRMLDPFFTTRSEGTGVGLTLVDKIARLHGGHLYIHSSPSPHGGARIDFRIPYSPPDGANARS